MRVSVLLQITDDEGVARAAEPVAVFEKSTERPEDVGLSISEGKTLMAAVQCRIVESRLLCSNHHQRSIYCVV